jgi:hypothetical protein
MPALTLTYIATCTRPDLCAPLQLLAGKIRNPKSEDFAQLRKIVRRIEETSQEGLNFRPLNVHSLQIGVFSDAAFANADNYGSQLGWIIVLMDDDKNANIVHYSSAKCHRVTRSVLAGEMYALTHAFDIAYTLRHTLEKYVKAHIPVRAFTDSQSLFDCVTKLSTTLEKRLMIDLYGLRQSYERRELTSIAWIPGGENPADALTKADLREDSPLFNLMRKNRIQTSIKGWVDRDI